MSQFTEVFQTVQGSGSLVPPPVDAESEDIGNLFFEMCRQGMAVHNVQLEEDVVNHLLSMPDMGVDGRFTVTDRIAQVFVCLQDQNVGIAFNRMPFSVMSEVIRGEVVHFERRNDDVDRYYSVIYDGVKREYIRHKIATIQRGHRPYVHPQLPSVEKRAVFGLSIGEHGEERVQRWGIDDVDAFLAPTLHNITVVEPVHASRAEILELGRIRSKLLFSTTSVGTVVVDSDSIVDTKFKVLFDARPLSHSPGTDIMDTARPLYVITMIPSGNDRVEDIPGYSHILAAGGDEALANLPEHAVDLFSGSAENARTNGKDFVAAELLSRVELTPPVRRYMHTWLGMFVPLNYWEDRTLPAMAVPSSRTPLHLDVDCRTRVCGIRLHHAMALQRRMVEDPRGLAASVANTFLSNMSRILGRVGVNVPVRALCGVLVSMIRRVPLSQYFFHTRESMLASGKDPSQLLIAHLIKMFYAPMFTKHDSRGVPIPAPTYAMLHSFLPEQFQPFESFILCSPLIINAFKMFTYGDTELKAFISSIRSLAELRVVTPYHRRLISDMALAYTQYPHVREAAAYDEMGVTLVPNDRGVPSPVITDIKKFKKLSGKFMFKEITKYAQHLNLRTHPLVLRCGPLIHLVIYSTRQSTDVLPCFHVLTTTFQKTGFLPNEGSSKHNSHAAFATLHGEGGLYNTFRAKL